MKTSTNKNKIKIDFISDIRFGFYAKAEKSGSIPYLQVRQFNEHGIIRDEVTDYINLNKKSEPHLLKDGDVLFVGKGNRLFAWCYQHSYGPYIASSIFFVLRPNQNIIYPEYLAAVLNAPQIKAKFQQLGSGTNIFSIRKSELGATEIKVPPMDDQKKIVALADLHQKEIAVTHELLTQKQNLYTGIFSQLIK